MPFNPTIPDPQIERLPFFDPSDLRPGQEGQINKDQLYLNGYFEPIESSVHGIDYHFVKRPGLSIFQAVTPTGPGRGVFAWKQTNQLYSVNGNKILSGNTDLGVTMGSSAGIVQFEETRPGATTQYLGINDGNALYLIATDNSVLILNNVTINTSSVANPTTITTATAHNLLTGNKVIIRNHTGSTPPINDTIFTITKTGTNTFTIPVNVTVGGTGGTIGVFPSPNTGDLQYMDTNWFTMKTDGTIWNCANDDPTSWPVINFITSQMLPGRGIGLTKQSNVLLAYSDRHYQQFFNNANPVGSPLANVEQAMQRVGSISRNTIASDENTSYWVSNTNTGGFTVYRLDGTSGLQDIGNGTLNRSLSSNFFSVPGSPQQVRIFLTSGTSWTVPADFNKNNNTIEGIGGGAGGTGPIGGVFNSSFGGGGGAYAKLVNFDPAGAGTIPFTIGIGGPNGSGMHSSGGDTTFNITSLIAKGGGTDGISNQDGGLASSCFPTTFATSGGNGGDGFAGAPAGGGGGGGAGGIFSNGNDGLAGTSGANNNNAGSGGQGDGNLGGQGGINDVGGNGSEWDATHGSGGGGSGSSGALLGGNHGFDGGLYGGGGGAGGVVNGGGTFPGGNGSPGIIVITYIPTTATTVNSVANAFIARMSGHIFYVLNLINNNETWVYDQKYQVWSKWTSGTTRWPVVKSVQFAPSGQATFIAGQDPTLGTLWKIDPLLGQDNGNNFEYRIQTSPMTFGTMTRKYFTNVTIIGDRPPTSTPVNVSYTDDDFVSLSTPKILDISNIHVFSKAWGNSRRRGWIISYTGPNIIRLYGLELILQAGLA